MVPEALQGTHVLDLGSGAGRDCYMLSSLVGEEGRVMGVDMTPEQLEVANRHISYHTEKFGFKSPNVQFRLCNIQKLHEAGIKDETFDIVVYASLFHHIKRTDSVESTSDLTSYLITSSNCVLNLCADKEAVLREAHRVLKQGGEFYFSDVYADRRLPRSLMDDSVLYGECISGALYWKNEISHQPCQKGGVQGPKACV